MAFSYPGLVHKYKGWFQQGVHAVQVQRVQTVEKGGFRCKVQSAGH